MRQTILLILLTIVLPEISVCQEKHPPITLDERMFYSINHWGNDAEWMDGPMKFLTNTAFVPVIAVPVGLYFTGDGSNDNDMKRAAVSIGAGLAGTVILGELIIKNIVRRDRPYRVIEGTRLITDGASGFSFPSGHSSTSAGLAAGLTLFYPKWYVITPAVLYSVIVMLSRPYLGMHYVSDLLGGAVLGIGIQLITRELTRDMYPRKNGSESLTSNAEIPIRIGWSFHLP